MPHAPQTVCPQADSLACARQTVGDAVASWLPDHIGHDHFAANYTQSYNPGLAISATGFAYAPCIISNVPVGAIVAPAAISISPLGVYITPEGANFQPEGFKVRGRPLAWPCRPVHTLHGSPRPALPLCGLPAACSGPLCHVLAMHLLAQEPARFMVILCCKLVAECIQMHKHSCAGRMVS